MAYTQVFGGTPIQSTDEGYISYNISADLQLDWPEVNGGTTTPAVQIIEITATVGGLTVFVPPANETSLPSPLLIRNVGLNSITINRFGSTAITVIASGQAWFLYITDNSTSAGTWNSVQFGAATSSANAAALAGSGLLAIGSTLNSNYPVLTINTNTNLTAANRGNIYNWTGGTGVVFLPDIGAANVGTGYMVGVHNSGTAELTLFSSFGHTIDGQLSLALVPGESVFVFSQSPTRWFTVGLSRATTFSFEQLTRNVGGNVNVTLTSLEANNFAITFTGVLTGNISVIFPAIFAPYILRNNTTGAFGLTARTASGVGVPIPQGQTVWVYNNGTDIVDADTVIPTVTGTFADGTAASPPISFTGSPTDGIYHSAGSVNFTVSGVQRGAVTAQGISSVNSALLYDNMDMLVLGLLR